MDGQEAAGGSSPHGEKTVERDGVRWPLARQEDLAWLSDQTDVGLAITSAIPPIYEAYGTVVAQEEDNDEYEDNDDEDNAAIDAQERQLVKILQRYGSTSWWLGFIEGGEDEQLKPLFPHTKRIRLYVGWPYVVVLAGPAEALRWGPFLPDLIVPADHSWCLSTLWDDSWACIGGPAALIQELAHDASVQLRRVTLGEDATPPGHIAV